jgi:hypothetical protein
MTRSSLRRVRTREELQISPLRYAPVEMTNLLHRDVNSHKGRGQLLNKFVISTGA